MKAFVISLVRSTERRRKIKKQLDNAGIVFEFFDAIDSSTSDFKYSERRAPKQTKLRFGYQLLESELACFASHLCLWGKCVELNEPILIFEDSFQLNTSFIELYSSFNELVKKYPLIKLCSLFPKKFTTLENINEAISIVSYKRRTCGTQSYLLTPHAANKLMQGAMPFLEPVDHYIEKSWRHGVSVCSFKPNIVERSDIVSTIGSSRKNKKGVQFWHKIIIESFRTYERTRAKFENLTFIIARKRK